MIPSLPDEGAVAATMLDLGRELHLELSEGELCDRFLTRLAGLFPERRIAVRVLDPRTREPARVHALHGALRPGLETERVTIKESSIAKTRLKTAVAASARIRIGTRWDSPFAHVAAGFAVPLVASGELYGLLDVGYQLGVDLAAKDEALVMPVANQLALALRNQRLWRDAQGLRDFQTRLIENANALIVGIDRSWRVTVCNRAMLELTGFSRDEVLGADLRDLLPPDQRPRLTPVFAAALRGQTQDAVDVVLLSRHRGRVRTVWSIAAIGGPDDRGERGAGGATEAVVAIGTDQTRLRELQDQVIQAERLATLGQLAAGVVHELNNPLTSITVYAEYLLKKAERAGAEVNDIEKLARIGQSAQRIMRFARELVQYAKPAGDEIDVVDLNAVVRQSLSFCEHLFDRAGILVSTELDPELPPIPAVPGQLEQVLINLLTNASHAIENGGTIVVRTATSENAMVSVAVDDSGPGIAVEDRAKIFEPFYTTKTDGKGTGLGLPIVKNIVEQHRGAISVEQAPEGGARFIVRLPRTA